jgi:hypothetical protein
MTDKLKVWHMSYGFTGLFHFPHEVPCVCGGFRGPHHHGTFEPPQVPPDVIIERLDPRWKENGTYEEWDRNALPDIEGWNTIDTAPLHQQDIRVLNAYGEHVAHYACDLSGEDQPPFKGWFAEVRDESGKVTRFEEVSPKPTHWRPLQDGAGR